MASGDHRLAQIAEYGEVHVVVWEGHPLASRLESATVAVYRLPWPTTANAPVAAKLNLVTELFVWRHLCHAWENAVSSIVKFEQHQ